MPKKQTVDDDGGGPGFDPKRTHFDYLRAIMLLATGVLLVGLMDRSGSDSRMLDVGYLFDTLDLFATAIFAASAAAVAVQATVGMPFGIRRDLIIISAAFLTANGGGTARDILSMQTIFWWNAGVYAVLSIAIGYFAARCSLRCNSATKRLMDVFDNCSAGVFAASGVLQAAVMIPPTETGFLFLAAFMGTVTAIGGGILRDLLLLRRAPIAFTTTYGIAAFAGSLFQGFVMVYVAAFDQEPIIPLWTVGLIITFLVNELTVGKHPWPTPKTTFDLLEDKA